jgi:hypothetical protein
LFVKVEVIMPRYLDLDDESLNLLRKLLNKVDSGIRSGYKLPKLEDKVFTVSRSSIDSFGAFGAPEQDPDDDYSFNNHSPFSQFFFR